MRREGAAASVRPTDRPRSPSLGPTRGRREAEKRPLSPSSVRPPVVLLSRVEWGKEEEEEETGRGLPPSPLALCNANGTHHPSKRRRRKRKNCRTGGGGSVRERGPTTAREKEEEEEEAGTDDATYIRAADGTGAKAPKSGTAHPPPRGESARRRKKAP